MAYYRGDYYSGRVTRQRNPFAQRRVKSVGDYYYGHGRGDPFWGALFKGIGKVAKNLVLGPAAPPSAEQIAMNIRGFLPAPQGMPRMAPNQFPMPENFPPRPGTTGRQLPDINLPSRQISIPPTRAPQIGFPRRRRMNPANSRALNRAIRRVTGFGRLASRAKRSVSRAATQLGCYRRGSTVRRKR